MPEYCKECGGEILNVNNKVQVERSILQALLIELGVHISPSPTYCRCNEGLKPLELRKGGLKSEVREVTD